MTGPVREIIPIANPQVQIQIPDGRRVKAAKLLVARKSAPFKIEENFILVEVPSISVHEVIVLDLMPHTT